MWVFINRFHLRVSFFFAVWISIYTITTSITKDHSSALECKCNGFIFVQFGLKNHLFRSRSRFVNVCNCVSVSV